MKMNGLKLEKMLREMLSSHAIGNLVAELILRQYYVVSEFTETDALRSARLFADKEILSLKATGKF